MRANNKIFAFFIFLCSLAFYYLVYFFVGFIPIAGGSGFDGSVYVDYILKIASGTQISNDPYRLIRVSGFLPAILGAYLGLGASGIVVFQAVVNALMLSVAAAMFYSTMHELTGRKSVAITATGIMVFSWPYLVMPIYYPVLSDHVALFMSVISIWAWEKSRNLLLCVVTIISVWIMPGIFLIPLMLSIFPHQKGDQAYRLGARHKFIFAFLACVMLFFIGYILYRMLSMTDAEVVQHPPGLSIGMADLRSWSTFFVSIFLLCIGCVISWVVAMPVVWERFSMRNMLSSSIALIVGVLSVNWAIDWTSGNHGPPLIHFLLSQAISAPIKPIVSHFLYFGPVLVVALISCVSIKDNLTRKEYFPLFFIILAYSPILILGSESRQWVSVFPIAVAFVAAREDNLKICLVLLFFAMMLCLPMIFLQSETSLAVKNGFAYISKEWQLYFGRQGPWMSHRTYTIGLVSMLAFFILYSVMQRKRIPD
ncbi:hypothetical protein [Delftia sp. WSY_22]|uniref:hypothetical protein n=1 Tax=Delftia sp. WSY_22 TaxID=3367213 RepID=UPI00370BB259